MKQFKVIIKDNSVIAENEDVIMEGLRPVYLEMHKLGLRPKIEIIDTGREITIKEKTI